MILTWDVRVGLDGFLKFDLGNVVRIDGRNYAVVRTDEIGIRACLADENGELLNDVVVVLPWHLIKKLHIY